MHICRCLYQLRQNGAVTRPPPDDAWARIRYDISIHVYIYIHTCTHEQCTHAYTNGSAEPTRNNCPLMLLMAIWPLSQGGEQRHNALRRWRAPLILCVLPDVLRSFFVRRQRLPTRWLWCRKIRDESQVAQRLSHIASSFKLKSAKSRPNGVGQRSKFRWVRRTSSDGESKPREWWGPLVATFPRRARSLDCQAREWSPEKPLHIASRVHSMCTESFKLSTTTTASPHLQARRAGLTQTERELHVHVLL